MTGESQGWEDRGKETEEGELGTEERPRGSFLVHMTESCALSSSSEASVGAELSGHKPFYCASGAQPGLQGS